MADTTQSRILIESEALRLSIRLGGDGWETGIVAALHALSLQSQRAQGGDPAERDRLEERHHAFHRALIDACGSRWLLGFFETLYAESERYRSQSLGRRRADNGRDIEAEHRAIAEAALARDPDRATDLLASHYRRTEAAVLSHLG
jgi:DNA-binding GntR family transcriptional regulator